MHHGYSLLLAAVIAALMIFSAPASIEAKAGKSLIAPVVVEINNEPIYETELLYFLIGRHGQEVLSELIENAILASKADEFHINVGKDEPRQEMIRAYGEEKFKVLSEAFDIEKILLAVKRDYLARKVYDAMIEKITKDSKIEISENEALDYYLKNVEDWSRPAMVRFSIIVTKTKEDADKALGKLNEGVPFADVAKELSIDKATKDAGGDLGEPLPQGYFRGPLKEVENFLFTLPLNKWSQVIAIESNFFIVMPTQRFPAEEKKFNEVKSYIVDELTIKKVEPILQKQLDSLRDKSKIEVYYPIFDTSNEKETGFTKVLNPPASTTQCLIYPIVVKVNNETISEDEMIFFLMGRYGQELLQELIENMVLYQQAKQLGVEVDKNEPKKILEDTYTPEKLAALEKAFDMNVVRNAIHRELMARKGFVEKKNMLVKESGISVSESNAKKYFDANKDKWVIPERARFSIIVTEREDDAKEAAQQIKNGKTFEEIAKKYSIDKATVDSGGDIGTLWPRGLFVGPFVPLEDKIFEMNVSEMCDPIFIEDRFYIVKVTEKKPREEKQFDEVKETIINSIIYTQVSPLLDQWLDEIRKDVKIDFKYPIFDVEKEIAIDPSKLQDEQK